MPSGESTSYKGQKSISMKHYNRWIPVFTGMTASLINS